MFADGHPCETYRRATTSTRCASDPAVHSTPRVRFQDVPLRRAALAARATTTTGQYNLGWAGGRKDTNSAEHVGARMRRDDVIGDPTARLPRPGLTSQATAILNVNREGNSAYYNNNASASGPPRGRRASARLLVATWLERRRALSGAESPASAYARSGATSASRSPRVAQDIRAGFRRASSRAISAGCAWRLNRSPSATRSPSTARRRGSTRSREPAVRGPPSFWIRQPFPAAARRACALPQRRAPSLRSSKDQGPSNL